MATAKQKAWRAKFARLYGGKKKRAKVRKRVRRVKVRKMRVRRRSRPVKVSRGHKSTSGILSGVSKKGLLFYLASFLLSDGMTKVDTLRANGFSAPAQSEVFYNWRTNNLAGYILAHYTMWKYGDCGIVSKMGAGAHVHRKALAMQSFAYTYGDVPKYYTHFKTTGVNGPSLKTAMNTALKSDPLAAAAAGYSLYKYGTAVSVDGVN